MKDNNLILTFDWILKIPIDSMAIFLLLLPPIYPIWVYKIGTVAAKRQGQPSGLFKIACLIFVLTSGILFILHDHLETLIIQILIILTIILWTYICVFAARMTIKYETKDNEKLPHLIEYVHRFGQIMYWLFGIWVLQPKLNNYFEKE